MVIYPRTYELSQLSIAATTALWEKSVFQQTDFIFVANCLAGNHLICICLYYCSLLIYLFNSPPPLCRYFWPRTMPQHKDFYISAPIVKYHLLEHFILEVSKTTFRYLAESAFYVGLVSHHLPKLNPISAGTFPPSHFTVNRCALFFLRPGVALRRCLFNLSIRFRHPIFKDLFYINSLSLKSTKIKYYRLTLVSEISKRTRYHLPYVTSTVNNTANRS